MHLTCLPLRTCSDGPEGLPHVEQAALRQQGSSGLQKDAAWCPGMLLAGCTLNTAAGSQAHVQHYLACWTPDVLRVAQ